MNECGLTLIWRDLIFFSWSLRIVRYQGLYKESLDMMMMIPADHFIPALELAPDQFFFLKKKIRIVALCSLFINIILI